MRLARLSLARYGHFENCDLDFPQAACDFHLIYGPNEAGKSTTLAAVNDLLFGFPARTAYAFNFDNALLRVGAVLEHEGASIGLRRRKGNRDTLQDPDGNPLPDSVLIPMLHGLTAETFRLTSSLDHVRLRQGGHAILEAKDDIGQALFAAGSGMLEAQALLHMLKEEADSIWAARRAAKRSYWKCADEQSEALTRLKSAEVKPKDWIDAQTARDAAESALARLTTTRADREAALRRVQRIRRLAGTVQRRAALLQAIDGLAPSPFDPGSEAMFRTAIDTLRVAGTDQSAAAADAAELARRRDLIQPDANVLAQRAAIEAATLQAGAAAKAETDLPALRAKLDSHLDRIATHCHDLGWPDADLPGLLARIPSRLELDELRDQLATRQTIESERLTLGEAFRTQEATRNRLEAELAAHQPPKAAEMLARAIRTAQRAAALDTKLPAVRRTALAAARDLQAALTTLTPWTGDAATLAIIAPPSAAETSQAEETLRQAGAEAVEAARDLTEALKTRDRLELERRHLLESGGAVAPAQLEAARSDRDQAWMRLRAGLEHGKPIAPAALTAFESALQAADALADTRYAKAEASARLSEAQNNLDRTRLSETQARQRQAAAEQALAVATCGWEGTLAAHRLPPMPPARAQAWRTEHAEALRAAARAADAENVLQDDTAKLETAVLALQDALHAAGAPSLPPGTPFTRALTEAEAFAHALAQAQTQRTKLETRLQATRDFAETASRRLAQLDAEEASWLPTWFALATRAGLADTPWDAAGRRLGLFETLRTALNEARELRHRVDGIERVISDFDQAIRTLATTCGLCQGETGSAAFLASALRDRLDTAQADFRARQELQTSLEQRIQARHHAEHRASEARSDLAPLAAIAGTPDLPALSALLDRYDFQRRTQQDITEAEAKLLAEGDGLSLQALLAEAEGAEPDRLAGQETLLASEQADLNQQIAAKAEELGAARKTVEALDHGDLAARAASDVEQARAAMATEAEAYLLKRTQAVMLQWAVDRYQDRRQSPMLGRASQHFSTLTLGRYAELRIDPDSERPRLMGVHADGRSLVSIEGMSEGTTDQLFLALRLAALEQSIDHGVQVPFLADDLFINFDDDRAYAGFKVLGEIARKTQVLFFTHHAHLRTIAESALHPHTIAACELVR